MTNAFHDLQAGRRQFLSENCGERNGAGSRSIHEHCRPVQLLCGGTAIALSAISLQGNCN